MQEIGLKISFDEMAMMTKHKYKKTNKETDCSESIQWPQKIETITHQNGKYWVWQVWSPRFFEVKQWVSQQWETATNESKDKDD